MTRQINYLKGLVCVMRVMIVLALPFHGKNTGSSPVGRARLFF